MPRQALRLCPGGFPETEGRVSLARTGPGRGVVGRSPADNQRPPPRHLDQGCAVRRTGGEAAPPHPGGGSLCPFYRQGAPPPTPASAESKQGLRALCPGGEGPCSPSLREGPSESTTPPPKSAMAGAGVGRCRVSGPLIMQNSRAASPQPPSRSGHPYPRFFLGRLCLSEPPANAQPEPPQKRVQPGLAPPPPTPMSPSHSGGLTAARQALAQRADGSHGHCPCRPHHMCKGGRAACEPSHDMGSPPSAHLCPRGVWGYGHLTAGCVQVPDAEVLEGQTGRCPLGRDSAEGSPAQEARPGDLL